MFEIRTLKTIDEYRACEELQFEVWHMPDYLEVVPLHVLVAGQKAGGVLLAAFEGGKVLGFVFGFAGLDGDGRPYHYSHMMAVAPGVQGQGIGRQLKCAQREAVLAQGLDRICWTYDPLEARNGHLNITKLGAVCRTYLRDLYGTMADGLNAGLPSDRFHVDWWIATQRVAGRLAGRGRGERPAADVWVLRGEDTAAGLRGPGNPNWDFGKERVAVEIPASYQSLKAADRGLALAWRLAARQALEACFASGYLVVAMGWEAGVTGGRAYYILEHDEEAS